MAASLQRKAFWGMVWNFAESFSLQIIQFIIGIFMARILQPSDYGMVGMLTVFLAISNLLINSGFYRALIQKKDRTAIDYSTVFYFNIVVGLVLYLILFFSSPYIALFYNVPVLEDLTKVIAIPLILNSLSQVQNAKFTIEMNFKMLAKISIITAIITGISSLYMAYSGFGVWSIAYSSVIGESSRCILLWFFASWIPLWKFSWRSFKELFSFGFKIFMSAMIDTIYNNLYTLIIGKKFAATELGYYTRANGYAQLPVATFNNALSKVTFPMFCEVQKDDERMILLYHKLLRFMAFIIFPIMMLFIVLARPLILFMITDKWESCVILLQILCLSYIWHPVQIININMLEAKGFINITLKLEVVKKCLGVLVLFVTIPLGIVSMCIGLIVVSFTSTLINIYFTRKIVNIGILSQAKDLCPPLLCSLFMMVITYFVTSLIPQNGLRILVGGVVGIVTYFFVAYLFRSKELQYLFEFINKKKSI